MKKTNLKNQCLKLSNDQLMGIVENKDIYTRKVMRVVQTELQKRKLLKLANPTLPIPSSI